ncbi:MAG: hypothetical protein ABI439_03035 [Rhodospirillales bacterium]
MLPYTTPENDWLSAPSLPLTPSGHIDIQAIEAQARAARSRVIGDAVARLFKLWRGRRQAGRLHAHQARTVQHEMDRAALTMGRF